jgi:PhzF family phenazine biosynthesis protein
MTLKLWQIDAFAQKPLEGNPAAVVPLDAWLDVALMQAIADENQVAETAFFVKQAPGRYRLRWFTPTVEVDLCGHATLASSWLIFSELAPELNEIAFETRSGTLHVTRGGGGRHTIRLPSDFVEPYAARLELPDGIGEALGTVPPAQILKGRNLFAVFDNAKDVRAISGAGAIAQHIPSDLGLIATAPGDEGFDFISRFFAPHHGIAEDPVTGSAHCALTPYWSKRLGKKTLNARQVSPRGGNLLCTDEGAVTALTGSCALYLKGEIAV